MPRRYSPFASNFPVYVAPPIVSVKLFPGSPRTVIERDEFVIGLIVGAAGRAAGSSATMTRVTSLLLLLASTSVTSMTLPTDCGDILKMASPFASTVRTYVFPLMTISAFAPTSP